MTGPAKNTLNNMGIMSESLACGQEQLKSACRQILDVIKKPFLAIKDAIIAVVKAVKEVIKKIKEVLIKIKRVIMSICEYRIKVIYYRHNFLTKERFDNRFMTKNLVDIDLRRATMSKETVLPLNHRERKRYITVKSVRLTESEKKQLSAGLALLLSTALKIATHMAIDYSLYWIMNLIRKYGSFQSKVQAPNVPTVHIAGNGFLADLLKGVVKSFQPLGITLEIDTVPCLPTPIPPNIDRYIQIASILGFCLILTIFEPYGLRWRHSILCYYYPKRARERAVWLYNHILRSRSSFLKFARRQLRRKLLGSKDVTKVTCLEYLRSKTSNPFFLFFLGSDKQQSCLLCGEVFRKSDSDKPIKCQRPGCTAMYCRQCFEDLENICTVCLSPIEYGDMSDISEERDSSDEEFTITTVPTTKTDEDNSSSGDSGRESEDELEETNEGSSTDDYSYGYQEAKKEPSTITDFKVKSSRDLEKQDMPDYVSMQSFDDEIEMYSFTAFGIDDKDEETQFPEDVSISITCSPESIAESSSVASTFKINKQQRAPSIRTLKTCHCLSLDELDDPAATLLFEDSRESLTDRQEKEHLQTSRSPYSRELDIIHEQTEDEPLIEFSSDEEREMKSVILDSVPPEESSEDTQSKSQYVHKHLDSDISKEKQNSEGLLSDSELSETDVMTLIGKPKPKHYKTSQISSENSDIKSVLSNNEKWSKTASNVKSGSILNISKVTVSGKPSEKHEPRKILHVSQSDSSLSEVDQNKNIVQSKESDRNPISSTRSNDRHIEFIGLGRKKTSLRINPASTQEKLSIGGDKTYRSTISTKTSRHDIPSFEGKKKSILKMDSGSSIISELKTIQRRLNIPKHEMSQEASTQLSSGQSLGIGYDYLTEVSESKIHEESDEVNTKKRLKAGAGLPSEVSTITLIKAKIINQEKYQDLNGQGFSWASTNETYSGDNLSSPIYPFGNDSSRSTFSRYQSLLTPEYKSTRIDLRFFDSSNTSASSLDKQEQRTFSTQIHKRSTSNYNRNIPESDSSILNFPHKNKELHSHFPYLPHPISTTHETTGSMGTEEVKSTIKSSSSITEKKSVRISEVSDRTEEISEKREESLEEEEEYEDEEEEEGEETDASSDLSVSVQENILGIPKKKKGHKIDWRNEKGIEEDEPETTTTKREENLPLIQDQHFQNVSHHNSENFFPEKNITEITEQEDSQDKTEINTEEQQEKHQMVGNESEVIDKGSSSRNLTKPRCSSASKFVASMNDSRFIQNIGDRKCDCCFCRDKLPIIQHTAGGDPNRAILIHTGKDNCTQTCVDSSDRSCQIGASCIKMDSRCSESFNKKCAVRCKYKEEKQDFRKHRMGENCPCNICTRMRTFSDHDSRNDSHKNPCRPMRKDISANSSTSIRKCTIPKKKTTGTVCKPQMQDKICCAERTYARDTELYRCEIPDSDESPCSVDEDYRDGYDLPYQDNDEYKRLIRELEEKLVARNRERVRKTMREFEKYSTRNQNLKKPILYDDSSCGEEPILNKLVDLKVGDTRLRSGERPRIPSPPDSCKRAQVKGTNTVETMAGQQLHVRPPRFIDPRDPTHWQMDKRTGEWYKVSDVNICIPYENYEAEHKYRPTKGYMSPRNKTLEQYDDRQECEDCDELNRRYGHRYNILFCPRHRTDRIPRHRRK
ncbi:hypothetical protein HHI36_002584 [Cryptolaemus montrouzieri]|uniref:Uncharacterized protein n=1 Tax=Cryptolaemus montrouzieri TaxID=559131 RepID=A0ABD2PAY8_9CUCU